MWSEEKQAWLPIQDFPLKIPFMDRTDFQCAFVLDEKGDDELALYCGHPIHNGSSWCSFHYGIVYEAKNV